MSFRVGVVLAAVCCSGIVLARKSVDGQTQPEAVHSVWQLKPASRKVDDKPGIEGSRLRIGDPVHETLTIHALADANYVGLEAKERRVEFIRGIFWNDDPCGQLFVDNESLDPSYGVKWYWDFVDAESEAKLGPPKFSKLKCKLLGRSHFGDLQFLHGMANDDGVPAADTLAKMMAWAELMYRLSGGLIDSEADLQSQPLAAALKPSVGMTASALFASPNSLRTRQRALGSLLHMIQDSYGAGHVRRTVSDSGELGAIQQFHSYAKQDHDKHKADDMWQGGETAIGRIEKFKGGPEALRASTAIVRFYKKKSGWDAVRTYLETGPWLLAKNAAASGP
jgi:hypothetical protein